MATVINLNEKPKSSELSTGLKSLLEERKKARREPLTPEKLRKTPGLEHLTDEQAAEAIDTLHRLAKIFFDMACHKESICIDNQQVINLNQQNKAA